MKINLYRLKKKYNIIYSGIFVAFFPYLFIFFYVLYPPITNEILIIFIFACFSFASFCFFGSTQAMQGKWDYSRYLLEINSLKLFEAYIISLDKNFKRYFYSAIEEQIDKINPSDLLLNEREEAIELYSHDSSDDQTSHAYEYLKKFLERNKRLFADSDRLKNDLLFKYIRAIESVLYSERTFICEDSMDEEYEYNEDEMVIFGETGYEQEDDEIGSYNTSRGKDILLIDSSIIRKKLLLLWYETRHSWSNLNHDGGYQETNLLLFLEFISCFDAESTDYYINLTRKYIRNSLKLIQKTYEKIMAKYRYILDENQTID
ncbi:TPA: hypothetical protein P5R21_000728 [Legionella pneumophila]|uniref:hypothetical protein n=1 Tax=Legionella pneumophila TaxID=446 RepID=UPI001F4EADCF|nr:hypothetical protein [Legionella pneumophila]MCH9108504.1 hypothetical protein [Legionella pneumophila serogroup 1]MCH9115252.1 hypothetical protein [Legionella pneumophila serogroup 1]MDW8895615.1 hypothetical protein [Legionella pneumophila]MDW9033731.1 hypothetical protein [Legionella pneumophila]MDW9048717.1 hypothetical protein [Legionella pneumophila]